MALSSRRPRRTTASPILAKVKPGREQAVRDYGKTITAAVAATPDVLAPLKLHYLRWLVFPIGNERYFMYQGIFDTDFVILPMGEVEASGAPRSGGFGDAQIGATLGLLGAPALSRDEYAAFKPGFGLSLFGRVFFPTGEYSAAQPVNLGANRAAYQLGLPTVLAWGHSYRDPSLTTLEILPTLTFYADNDDPFAGARSAKDPLVTVESHLTHNFSQRIWLSADIPYRRGGETITDGIGDDNGTHDWSAGGTLALPVARASIVLTYEHVIERNDDGPDSWFLRTALILPLRAGGSRSRPGSTSDQSEDDNRKPRDSECGSEGANDRFRRDHAAAAS